MAFRIEHRIGVAASADTIWDILSDLPGWPRWNPLYPQAGGSLRIGGRLQLTEAFPNVGPRAIQPVIVDWEPSSQILWRSADGFMARSVRYLEIEKLSETGCIFANGAFFHGLLGEQTAKRARRSIQAGFNALGEALKAESERLQRDRDGPGAA
jgi:hypothetical protein